MAFLRSLIGSRSEECKDPWTKLGYSFEIDCDKPYFIREKMSIFKLDKSDASVLTQTSVHGDVYYAEDSTGVAKSFAKRMGIEASYYGAFSAGVKMATTDTQTSKCQTSRLDSVCRASKERVTAAATFNINPASKLRPEVLKCIQNEGPEMIVDKIGPFYTTGFDLGGVMQKTLIVEMEQDDTEHSIRAELSAKYGAGLFAVGGTVAGETVDRKENSKAKMKVSWDCQGGDPNLWLSANKDNITQIQEKWSQSIDSSNMYAFDVQLKPIWELVKKVDPEKGRQVELFLTDSWSRQPPPQQLKRLNRGVIEFKEGAHYYIKPKHSKRYVHVKIDSGNHKPKDGDALWLWDATHVPQCKFEFQRATGSYWYIKPQHSEKYIHCYCDGGDPKDGNHLQLWAGYGPDQTMFAFECSQDEGWFYWKPKHTDRYVHCEVTGGEESKDGDRLWLWRGSGYEQTKFKFVEVE